MPVSLLDRIEEISDTEYFVKLLLYGPMGSGKTRFCADAPNPVWNDVERSAETFRRIEELKHMPLFVPKTFEEMFNFAREVVAQKKFSTLVYDTIGRAQGNHLKQHLAKETNNGAKRNKYLALWGDYRISTEMLDDFFVFLQEAPIHVIFIAHDKEIFDQESGNLVAVRPDLTPALAKSLGELINIVAYLTSDTSSTSGAITRKLQVNPGNKVVAKNRLNIQQLIIPNPNFKEIFLTD